MSGLNLTLKIWRQKDAKTKGQFETVKITDAGDIILCQGNSITIYYDKNIWNFTRLARIDNVNKKRLQQILGKGNVKVIFSVE